MSARLELIAHRGASRERPENTLPAFFRALELGADGLELDVHATRDGVIVVHHDAAVGMGGNAPGPDDRRLAELRYEDLRRLRTAGGGQIPSLAEVLEAIGDRAEVYVEIKASSIEREVVRTIRDGRATERCAVHSFDHRMVKRVRSLEPALRTGILLSSYLIDTRSALAAAGAADCWMWWEFIDEELVHAVHGAGGRVIAWTVNDPAAAATLAAMGVNGLCSDTLPAIRRAVAPGE